MYYSVSITDSRLYDFCDDTGLESVTLGKPNKKGERSEYRKYIANFWPKVIRLIKQNNNGTVTIIVELVLFFVDGSKSVPITVPLNGLDKVAWPDVVSKCILNPEISKANEHIANIIRSTCHDAPMGKTTVIDRLGTHLVEGVPVFNAGDRLIWPEGLNVKPDVTWEPLSNTRLVIDTNCSEQDADTGMGRIADLSYEVGGIIFAFNLLNVTREAFIVTGVTPRSIVFVYGLTGVKKTTYTNFQSHIYNRDTPLEPPPRFNAFIPAAVKLLYEKSDCVLVLDDLYPSQNREIHKHQENTLLEITRVIGDGIEPARMRGQKVAKLPPRCGVLFTGEYCVGKGSDAARLLPIKMAVPINNDKLTACQLEPLMLSTFYNFFIGWYISNFDRVCELLREWAAAYRSTKTGIHDRLQETQFCLEAAYKLFLTYRIDKGFVSKATALEQYNSFYQQLRGIVKEQNARANHINIKNPDINYLALMRKLYHDKRFRLVESIKDFEAKEHDGIIHKDHLYLRREKLMTKLRAFEPSAEFDDVLKNLKEQQALRIGKDSHSRKIGGSRLRFYAVKLCKLT